jgi:TRAP-type C4-dicarboxylate transport system substrate-binding protein
MIRIKSLSLALLALAAPAAAEPEVTLRLHQFLPLTSSIPRDAIEPWIERVEAQSEGRLEIEHYPSMQLGGAPPALYDQARDGVVDIVWTVLGYTPGRFPRSEAFELPFMVTTAEATSRAFDRYVRENALEEFRDVHPILFHTHGPGLIHVRGEPVEALEDLRGLTLRGPTRIVTGMLEDLGAAAVGMPVPATPEALSKGVIDGAVIPWEVTLPLKVAELTDAHTEVSGDRGLYTATFVLAMNKDAYEALPEALKAVIDANSGAETAGLFGRAMDAMDVTGREVAEAEGNAIVVLPPEETERWREASRPAVERWLAEMAERGIDGQGLLDDARAKIEAETGG